ncbi:MAG TPA: hypothetical protein VFB65_03540 [Pyrinomonadaceae bacterium]|nr:hypothetical protein [Pyrinomonadaceae bacterium]
MQPKPDQNKKSGTQVKKAPTAQPGPADVGSANTPSPSSGQTTSGQTTSGQTTSGQTTSGPTAGQQTGGGNDLLQHAKQTTSEVVDQVQQQAGSRLDRQKDEAAKDLQQLAGALRHLGDELGGQQQAGPIAQYAAQYGRKAADGIERLTNYLRTNDTKALVSEIESFGRRQPALLLGGAFLLGLAGARFFKSSMSPSEQYTGRALPPPHQPSHVSTTTAAL